MMLKSRSIIEEWLWFIILIRNLIEMILTLKLFKMLGIHLLFQQKENNLILLILLLMKVFHLIQKLLVIMLKDLNFLLRNTELVLKKNQDSLLNNLFQNWVIY